MKTKAKRDIDFSKIKGKSGLKILFYFYNKNIWFLIAYIFILLLKAVLSFFEAMFIAEIITSIVDITNYKKALIYAGVCLGLALFSRLLSIVNTYFFKQLENRTKTEIQQLVLKRSLDIQMKSYDNMGSGLIVTRLTDDINALSTEFKSFTTRVVDLIKKSMYVIYIFFQSCWLGLFLVGTIIVTILMSKVRLYYFNKYKPGVRKSAEKVNSKIIEVVRGVKDIKTLNCSDRTLELLKQDQIVYNKKDNFEWYLGTTLCELTGILKAICNFFFIFLCIYFLKSDALTPLVFYTCNLYKDNVIDFATILEDLQMNLGTANIHAERIFKLINEDIFAVDQFGEKNIENYQGNITFKDVDFGYQNGRQVLNKTSFEIKPKQTVAFVGESGCGKSTIINLIAHLYYKDSGSILFDNIPIEDLSREFIKNNIAVVNQFPYIFNLSIRENFKIIKPDISDEEILNLCDKTNILEHINSLPNGLDSIIGENGCQFSGGQKQKLCIARALSRNVKILIFDEATSSLDNSNQTDIMQVIENLKNEITVILIAHRLSTITYADTIYIIKDGRVLDSGNHDYLLKNCDYYKNLYLNSLSIKE